MYFMISQPMRGYTDEQIKETRDAILQQMSNKELLPIDTFFISQHPLYEKLSESIDNETNVPVAYLALSISMLAHAKVLVMAKGWENAGGCVLEHDIAKAYGIEIVYF